MDRSSCIDLAQTNHNVYFIFQGMVHLTMHLPPWTQLSLCLLYHGYLCRSISQRHNYHPTDNGLIRQTALQETSRPSKVPVPGIISES